MATDIALVLSVACAVIVAALEVLLLLVSIIIIYHVVEIVGVEAGSLRRRLAAATAVAPSALHTALVICCITVLSTSSSGLECIYSPSATHLICAEVTKLVRLSLILFFPLIESFRADLARFEATLIVIVLEVGQADTHRRELITRVILLVSVSISC